MTAPAAAPCIDIRAATVADAAAVGHLIDAMDTHYNGAGNTAGLAGATALARATIASAEGTHFLVARDGGMPLGLACYAVIRPGHRHRGLIFLKDLFVVPEARSRGIGRALMRELARIAIAAGIGRIDLTAGEANTGAQRLYAELGGTRTDILMYRWSDAALAALSGAE